MELCSLLHPRAQKLPWPEKKDELRTGTGEGKITEDRNEMQTDQRKRRRYLVQQINLRCVTVKISSANNKPSISSQSHHQYNVQSLKGFNNFKFKMSRSVIERRSANYKPNIWTHQYLQSQKTVYKEERFFQRAEKLKAQVIALLERTNDAFDQIDVVDVLERLGISYHYTDYIDRILGNINVILVGGGDDRNLHSTALGFRLLRQHGYKISTEVFKNFVDENGNFRSYLCDDIKGLLSLYEASFLSFQGETIFDEAKEFGVHHLKEKLNQKNRISEDLANEIAHALEIPFHHRVPRPESRWFIEAYEKRNDMNPITLELAKLDFNMVQAMYKDELKELSSWYTKIRLAEKLTFARDRLVECYLWAVGFNFKPGFKSYRIFLTKMAVLATMIDDVYDVYGTLDELELFTDAIERWDINTIEQLPEYMKICFLALFNTINEASYDILRDHGFNIIPHSAGMWIELCKKYLIEAQWYHKGYKPSLDEYLTNGWVSVTGPMLVGHAYFYMTNPLKDKPLEDLKHHPEVLKWTSLACRLSDDLGTSSDELKRGDNPKSIQCYMHDTGCSEEDSRIYIKNLIGTIWKKINEDVLMNQEHSRDFINTSINLTRLGEFMYQYGDGHGIPDRETKDRVLSLVMEPIPLA